MMLHTKTNSKIKKQKTKTKTKSYLKKNNYYNNYYNPRLLNVNTILKSNNEEKNANLHENMNEQIAIDITNDITNINNIFNNTSQLNKNMKNMQNMENMQNMQTNYNIIKYLGKGIQGDLYLANDLNKNRYICKKIILNNNKNDNNNKNQLQQLEFELNILKYLSSNKVAKEYVNPCLEYKIVNNQVFTIFPIFDGYSLNHLSSYLKKLDTSSYYKIVFHLIKTVLFGLSKIHQTKIAHQNINNNSILVSTYKNPKEIKVKFTDFGLGCGNTNTNRLDEIHEAMINVNKYQKLVNKTKAENELKYEYNTCKKNNFAPVNITEDIIEKLTDSEHLFISQKYDLLCLGIIFIKLLLYFENLNVNLQNGYSNKNKIDLLDLINNKYLVNAKENNNDRNDNNYKKLFPFLNVKDEVLRDIIEYLKIFKEFILCKTENRKTCEYVLDKLIIYEKYKNDVF
jgi:serine/threonine protein kinase